MAPDNSAEARAREVYAQVLREKAPLGEYAARTFLDAPNDVDNRIVAAMLTFSAEQNTGGMPGREDDEQAWEDLASDLLEGLYHSSDSNEAHDIIVRALKRVAAITPPLPMILHCPRCHLQHIDEPDELTPEWDNPPHRSHLCHGCGCIWRPADVPTEGVAAIKTAGKADTSVNALAATGGTGAETMREAAAKACDRIATESRCVLDEHDARVQHRGILAGARACAAEIRAMPLPTTPTGDSSRG